MATWDDVRRAALALPGASERVSRGQLRWEVDGRLFVWERPLRKTDLAALGERAPEGPILGVRVEDLGVKEALIASEPEVMFTTPHFDGYPSVLVRLDRIAHDELAELVVEAWLTRAPRKVAEAFLEQLGDGGTGG